MKHLLLTTIAAVLVVGCGPSPPDISIHDAVGAGNIEAIKQHLAAGTDVDSKSRYGDTPLRIAAINDQKEIATLLITKGADVNAKNNLGGTPLHFAAFGGHKEIVELLITNGANVNARMPRMVGWHTPLHDAVSRGHKEVIELLIAKGADVNAKDSTFGRTLLHIAAREGHKEIVELLLAKGVDVNAKDKEGKTPLDKADEKPIKDLLRKHGGKTGEELKAEGK